MTSALYLVTQTARLPLPNFYHRRSAHLPQGQLKRTAKKPGMNLTNCHILNKTIGLALSHCLSLDSFQLKMSGMEPACQAFEQPLILSYYYSHAIKIIRLSFLAEILPSSRTNHRQNSLRRARNLAELGRSWTESVLQAYLEYTADWLCQLCSKWVCARPRFCRQQARTLFLDGIRSHRF